MQKDLFAALSIVAGDKKFTKLVCRPTLIFGGTVTK